MLFEFNAEDIYVLHNTLKIQIKTEASTNPRFGIDGNWYECMVRLRCLNPASYGCRAETKIREILLLERINASEDKGDSRVLYDGLFPVNNYLEIKVSFLDACKSKMYLRQIRLWQKIEYYLCVVVDPDNNPIVFVLNKKQMLKECSQLGTTSHGTKKANVDNENLERSISIDCVPGNIHYERWLENYLRPDISEILKRGWWLEIV